MARNSLFRHPRGITFKTSLGFALLALLLVIEGGINHALLRSMRAAESEMMLSMEIRQRIFEMDGELEKARRLHRDFFIHYPEVGFAEAVDRFFTPSQNVTAKVITLSEELRVLIESTPSANPLKLRAADINLYLSSAQRFSDTFAELVVLVNELAAPGTGLQSRLEEKKEALKEYARRETGSLLIFERMVSHEQRYWLTRQRSDLQAALNECFEMDRYFSSESLSPAQYQRVHDRLREYQLIARQIAEVDLGIRGRFGDFALQAKAVDPISVNLKSIASAEVQAARIRIDKANATARFLVMIMAGTVLIAVLVVGFGVHASVTRRIMHVTRVAEAMRTGDLEARMPLTVGDEIDNLALTLNEMAARLADLIGNLEGNVLARTMELAAAKEELEEAVRSLDEKNQALEILSRTDKLTALANRRRLEEVLQMEILRARRYGKPFSVIMFDVDRFKAVNDTFGHHIGDMVLIELARKMARGARETDIVGRWGGEEFLLVCPETPGEVGLALAERLRRSFAEEELPRVGRVTASFGVGVFQPDDDLDSLFHRVDQALYRAKNNGRNRVERGW